MYLATQFSIFMVNKPGVLAQILGAFAEAKINITAMTMVDSAEHGVLRAVFGDSAKARGVISQLNLPFSETDVLCVNLANKSGALAAVAEKLAKSHVSILYAYCTAGSRGGRTTGVLKVGDMKKTAALLDQESRRQAKGSPVVRRPGPGAR